MQEFFVKKDQDDSRADKILKEFCPNVSYVFLQKIFRTRRVKVNGKRIKASDHLCAGDKLQIFADLSTSENHVSETMPENLRNKLFSQLKKMIIFENDDLFAINKPAGLAVQLGTKISVCVETLIKSYPEKKCHLVHRLDKETSGTLLVAKNLSAAKKLSELFRENKIKKTYVAIVDGKISKSGLINSPIDSADAITKYMPLKQIGKYTLLKLQPSTGRKHQLRIHCARDLNAPILGDQKYNKNVSHKKMFLHAYKIQIPDLKIGITSPFPQHFSDFGISGADLKTV